MATSETSPTNANESLNATKQVTGESLESTLNANIKGLFGGFCLFGLLGLIIQQLRAWEMTDIPWTAGDWMLLSCFLLVIAAALIARGLRKQYDQVITRLWQRGVLNLGEADRPVPHSLIQSVIEHSHQRAKRFSLWGGIFFCSIAMFVLGIGETRKLAENLGIHLLLWNLLGAVLYMQIAYVSGTLIGRSVVYSSLARILDAFDIEIEVMPGHPDCAAGLKPVGDLFMRHAIIAFLPAIFIGIWLMLITIAPQDSESWNSLRNNYVDTFKIAFFIFLAIEVAGFIVPMIRFHLEMQRQKAELQVSADELSQRITRLTRNILSIRDQNQVIAMQSELDCLNQRHDEIELLPTWPINWVTWLRFGIANFCMVIPVLVQLWSELLRQ